MLEYIDHIAGSQKQNAAVAMHPRFVALQVTTTAKEEAEVEAAVEMLLLVAMGATAATTIATTPMEETGTGVTTVVMAALLKATMAMVAREATLLVVSIVTGIAPA